MEVIKGIENVQRDQNTLLTVGSFDGFHMGHQRIVARMRSVGGGAVTVLTFDPHPQTVVRSKTPPPLLISSFEERETLFDNAGVERLIVARFDKAFAQIAPEDYVRDILVGKIGFAKIFVGPNHEFGKDRAGNVDLLRKLGAELGFDVEVVAPVLRFNIKVSSSHIRRMLINDGDPLLAWRCLGRPFYLEGTVVKGDGRGKQLGIPTANLKILENGKLSPKPGIYATVCEVNDIRFPSVSHFGERPTFAGAKPSMEVHIIGFDQDLYGARVKLGVIYRLRDIEAFATPRDLVIQMLHDRENAKRRLAELGFAHNARLRIQRYGEVVD